MWFGKILVPSPTCIASYDESQNRGGCQPEAGWIRSAASAEPVNGSAAPSADRTGGTAKPGWRCPMNLSEYRAEKRKDKVPERVSYSCRKPRENFHRSAVLDDGALFSIQELRIVPPAQSLTLV